MIPGIGGVLARNLVAYAGSAEGVFKEPGKTLKKNTRYRGSKRQTY